MTYVAKVLTLDFGRSYQFKLPVAQLLMERLPASLELVVVAFIMGSLIGFPLGVLAALKRGTWVDDLIRVFGVLGFSLPTIWLGLVLQIFFGLALNFPVSGRIDPLLKPTPLTGFMLVDTLLEGNLLGFVDAVQRIFLPALSLALPISGLIMRMTRATMIEALLSDYIKTAKMKHLPKNVIVYKHALRNALIPIVTVVGLYFAVIATGDVVVETIFSWPGLGLLIYDAVRLRDYMVIQGAVLLVSLIYILVNLAVDVVYIYLDPRVRL